VEPLVREFVVAALSDPDTIQRGLHALVQRESEEGQENPELLAQTLRETLSDNARLRRAYQDQQAAGLMTLEELASRLEELEATRKGIEAELGAVERSKQKVLELQRDREAVLTSLAESIPEALDKLTSEEMNRVYRKLRLRVVTSEEGFDAIGVLCTLEPTPSGA
jgi:ParB-like chromosome segregation protein Spo0J